MYAARLDARALGRAAARLCGKAGMAELISKSGFLISTKPYFSAPLIFEGGGDGGGGGMRRRLYLPAIPCQDNNHTQPRQTGIYTGTSR